MMTNKTIGLFLLATTFLSSPAGAAALTPTLDTIKREAADLSGNFVLSELTSALPTGAVEVMIGDKSYYLCRQEKTRHCLRRWRELRPVT